MIRKIIGALSSHNPIRQGGFALSYLYYRCQHPRANWTQFPHSGLPPCHPKQAANTRRDTEYEWYEPKQVHNVPHGTPRVYSQGRLKSRRCNARKECRDCRDVEVSRRCSLLLFRKEHRQRWKEWYLIVLGYTKIAQLTFFTESLQFFCYGNHCIFGTNEKNFDHILDQLQVLSSAQEQVYLQAL